MRCIPLQLNPVTYVPKNFAIPVNHSALLYHCIDLSVVQIQHNAIPFSTRLKKTVEMVGSAKQASTPGSGSMLCP